MVAQSHPLTRSHGLIRGREGVMLLLIHHLIILYAERIEVDTLVEREDGVADIWIVGQTEILLGRARGGGGMTVPVGQYLQPLLAGVMEGGELILRSEGKMFGRVVYIFHWIVFTDHIAHSQQIATGLYRSISPRLSYKLLYNIIGDSHKSKV